MHKQKYLEHLTGKYAQLKSQFLIELRTGTNISFLKALNGIITTIGIEIKQLKNGR